MRILFILLMLFAISVQGQESFHISTLNDGYYKTYENFLKETPKTDICFDIEKRKRFNIKMLGGNDYKITPCSSPKNVNKYLIKKQINIIKKDDIVYINGRLISGASHYCKLYYWGRYSIIKATLPITKKKQEEYNFMDENVSYQLSNLMLGVVGVAIEGARRATIRLNYVIDLETSDIILLNKYSIPKLLQGNQKLINDFSNEIDQDNQVVLLKYIRILNQNNSSKDISNNETQYLIEESDELPFQAIIEEIEKINHIDSTLYKLKSDDNYENYLNRVIADTMITTFFIDIIQLKQYYGNGKPKYMGLKVRYNKANNTDYYYKVGTWTKYYKDGKIEEVINYNLREQKHGKYLLYDKDGKILVNKTFLQGFEQK